MNSHVCNLEHSLSPTVGATERSVAVSDSAVTLGTLHDRTRYVALGVGAAAVRVTYAGLTPTDAVGHYLAAGARIVVSRQAAAALKAIRATGSDSTLLVTELTE